MTDESTTGAGGAQRHPRRLDDAEMAVWLPLIRTAQLLPQTLDRTLRDASGLNHAHYAILITLAQVERPTMTELARIAGLSRSRLSHAIDALVARGWVSRSSCGGDGRTQSALLTEEGREVLRGAAPAHVAQIRELVTDRLDADEQATLARLLGALLPVIEASLERPAPGVPARGAA